jgi:non-heme chloroperoxidase
MLAFYRRLLSERCQETAIAYQLFRPRSASRADRSQLYKDLAAGPFFGFNRPGAKVSQGMIDSFWMQGMMGGHKNTYDCIAAFSETDFTEDLKMFDVPT